MFAKNHETIYRPESEKDRIENRLSLSERQKEAVRQITLGIEEVDPEVRAWAVEDGDIVKTLENGHPLNRVFANPQGETTGYIACEDFIPHEAYVKYFGTVDSSGRNLLREIPAFLEYAQQQGYTKINFHGWNNRLNRVLEHFGFKRLRTDTMGRFAADFYEKALVEQKTPESVEEKRRRALEEKYIEWLNKQYQKTLATFSKKLREGENQTPRQEKERIIEDALQKLSSRLSDKENADRDNQDIEEKNKFKFDPRQRAVLKLKLARHFQRKDAEDLNTLFDAIIESPNFINTDKGSLDKLLEVHEQKTLQKIAEIRKRRAEMKGTEGLNPYENLFTTKSGKYYLARLLNMPHLEQESEYMRHCVGTSNSYVDQMRRGEIEILSFRHVPEVNSQTQKLEGDVPIITIEYNLKTKTIEQIKKFDDEYLSPSDPFFDDVLDVLKQLRSTTTDTGEFRRFASINPSELENFEVRDYHILTEKGEVHFRDFNPEDDVLVLKTGNLEVTEELSAEDACKILRIATRVKCRPDELARKPKEIKQETKVYIGPFFRDILETNIEHIYSSFPGSEIWRWGLEAGGKSFEQYEKELREKGIKTLDYSQDMLKSEKFTTLKNREKINLVRLRVRDLGFEGGATTDEIYRKAEELGLELCPPEVGPDLRLKYLDQPFNERFVIGMKQIADRLGDPNVFVLERDADGLCLNGGWIPPDFRWNPDNEFVFRFRKQNLKTLLF